MFSLLLLVLSILYGVKPSTWKFVHIADPHLGYYWLTTPTTMLTQLVSDVNDLVVSDPDVKFVVVGGDLADHGTDSEFAEAKTILDGLTIPYFPLPGNHDMRKFFYNATHTIMEPGMTGDFRFGQAFSTTLQHPWISNCTADVAVPNPELDGADSYFINYEFRYDDVVFMALDFNSRNSNPWEEDPFECHSLCTAVEHDFPGGTLRWFEERLAHYAAVGGFENIVLFFHHGLIIPDGLFQIGIDWGLDTRTTVDYLAKLEWEQSSESKLKHAMLESGIADKIWGDFSGHWHFFWDSNPYAWETELAHFREWQSPTTRDLPMYSLVTVTNNTISNISCVGGEITFLAEPEPEPEPEPCPEQWDNTTTTPETTNFETVSIALGLGFGIPLVIMAIVLILVIVACVVVVVRSKNSGGRTPGKELEDV